MSKKTSHIIMFIFDFLVIVGMCYATRELIIFNGKINSGHEIIEQVKGYGYFFMGFVVLFVHAFAFIKLNKVKKQRVNKMANYTLLLLAVILVLIVPRVIDYKFSKKLIANGYKECGYKRHGIRLYTYYWLKGEAYEYYLENKDNKQED